MPLLIPMLLKNWKLIAHIAVYAIGAITIWYLHTELNACHAEVTAFRLVQEQDQGVLKDQNRAIDKMRIDAEKARKASVIASGIMAKTIVESHTRIVFKKDETCAQNVQQVFEALRSRK